MSVSAHARALAVGALAVLLTATVVAPAGATEDQTPLGDVKRVVFVGNNWEGTVDLLEPRTFDRLGRINMIPDQDERMMEIATNPERLAYYLAIREAIGEGHDQLVDDMYTSNDGRLLIASRPSYADVVAISLETHEIVWRFPVAGQRSDHMAISPDGRNVVVSASTGERRARRSASRTARRWALPVRGLAARERLHRRRREDPAREHRLRLHADRPGPDRPRQGRAGLPDRRRQQPSRCCGGTTCARQLDAPGSTT